MGKNKFLLSIVLLFALSMLLVACGGSSDDKDKEDANTDDTAEDSTEGSDDGDAGDFSVAMVTDTGGVDDKSFNQSAWEGLQAWGEEHGLEKGQGGYDYAQSEDDSDYLPNFSRLIKNDFDLVFGVGFLLQDAVRKSLHSSLISILLLLIQLLKATMLQALHLQSMKVHSWQVLLQQIKQKQIRSVSLAVLILT